MKDSIQPRCALRCLLRRFRNWDFGFEVESSVSFVIPKSQIDGTRLCLIANLRDHFVIPYFFILLYSVTRLMPSALAVFVRL